MREIAPNLLAKYLTYLMGAYSLDCLESNAKKVMKEKRFTNHDPEVEMLSDFDQSILNDKDEN